MIIVQNLERVADHACNIAESVIFTVQGKMPKLEAMNFPSVREILSRELPVFDLLLRHARLVLECMWRLPLAWEAYIKKDQPRFEDIAKQTQSSRRSDHCAWQPARPIVGIYFEWSFRSTQF
ncbi:MAG: hypothetical protein ACK40V_02560 [Anaerolineales bacterium]